MEFWSWRRMLHDDEPWHYSTINLSVWRVMRYLIRFESIPAAIKGPACSSSAQECRGRKQDYSFHEISSWYSSRLKSRTPSWKPTTLYEAWNTVEQQIVLIKPTYHKWLWNTVILLCLKVLHNYCKRQKNYEMIGSCISFSEGFEIQICQAQTSIQF